MLLCKTLQIFDGRHNAIEIVRLEALPRTTLKVVFAFWQISKIKPSDFSKIIRVQTRKKIRRKLERTEFLCANVDES